MKAQLYNGHIVGNEKILRRKGTRQNVFLTIKSESWDIMETSILGHNEERMLVEINTHKAQSGKLSKQKQVRNVKIEQIDGGICITKSGY